MDEIEIKKKMRKSYAEIAKKKSSCCSSSCCEEPVDIEEGYKKLSYVKEELKSLPEDVFSLGCGNPVGLASLKEDKTVLDLGSGSGFDCFLASKRVGEKGRVIGVDMTPEMVDRAKKAARKGNYGNVEFILGEIENLPVADNSIDIIISNCVINLSSNKKRVFEEAFRVLKPGGRLIISDIVLLKELPKAIRENEQAYIGCISGAALKNEYLKLIKSAGFKNVKILRESQFPTNLIIGDSTAKVLMEEFGISNQEAKEYANSIVSITVYGIKPNKPQQC
ncbi:MAG: arsenite methyltransferase [Candidatus Methanomethylicia archaeon]|nr:arsenite methyltransferase [Candidatus Methanomethylicia archaeon]MCX8169236.1 arsenite methyltransferase [Candidatus Methanomethylicia archaeon]MDW7988982.1 arsenite methyltransferase [Nitrososphaerota archaeon]